MTSVYIEAIGMAAPGMNGWSQGRSVLLGETPLIDEKLVRYKPNFLPANESRRATDLVRLAFHACEDAVAQLPDKDLSRMGSVFCSSGGDHQIIDQICRVVSDAEPMVSPTQFHNSVHNSAVGYWGIATKSRKASSSLATGKYTFAAGLVEAYTTVITDQLDILFVCYETLPPEPLCQESDVMMPFASAYVLSTEKRPHSLASLSVKIDADKQQIESQCKAKSLEKRRLSSAASRALPVLEFLAHRHEGDVVLPINSDQLLTICLEPCV